MIEFGVVAYGIITGNVMASVAWVLLVAYNFIPAQYKIVSAVAVMILPIVRSILKAGGGTK